MAGSLHFVATRSATRVDRLICEETGHGRRIVRRWFAEGRVRIDGRVAGGADGVASGSEIVIESEDDETRSSVAQVLPVVFESDALVVVAKPAGLHSERGRSAGSVATLLENRYGDASGIGVRPEEAGLVHRLDRDTSGVVVAARTRSAYEELRRAFAAGRTTKQYLALAGGRIDRPREIHTPLAQRGTRVVAAGAKDHAEERALEARTFVEPLDGGADWSLVLATMHTGVMHQIRCHMSGIGHPLFGDVLYGGSELAGSRRRGQLLHAFRIRIGSAIDVATGPPDDFLESYAALRRRAR